MTPNDITYILMTSIFIIFVFIVIKYIIGGNSNGIVRWKESGS